MGHTLAAVANRLIAYRVVAEMERRSGRGRRPRLTMPEITERLLKCLVRSGEGKVDWNDYQLAGRAQVSVRQTAELYEEVGLGALVREALDHLHAQGLITIERRALSGPYQGFAVTERGAGAVNLDPWYKRALAFFDPPKGG